MLISATACEPSPSLRVIVTAVPVATRTVVPTPTPDAALSTPPLARADTCPPGEPPLFVLGFAGLKERLGDRMGEAVSCELPGPEGDALQQTTTGLARYRK